MHDVKITVKGPDERRVERVANIPEDTDLEQAISTAFEVYRELYPDAPPYRKTVQLDPA